MISVTDNEEVRPVSVQITVPWSVSKPLRERIAGQVGIEVNNVSIELHEDELVELEEISSPNVEIMLKPENIDIQIEQVDLNNADDKTPKWDSVIQNRDEQEGPEQAPATLTAPGWDQIPNQT